MIELEIRPNVKRVESATVSIEDGREGSERNDNIFDTQNNPLTTRGTMERNWDSKTPPPAPKAKPDKLDPSEAPPAEYQIAQALYICFVVQLWRGTWYAWDYGLGFGWTGTMSSLVVGLFVISCFRSIHCLRRLVPVNPEVLVPGRFSIFAPAVSRGSIERFSVYDADESKLSIKRRIPRQVAHIVLVMACCSACKYFELRQFDASLIFFVYLHFCTNAHRSRVVAPR